MTISDHHFCTVIRPKPPNQGNFDANFRYSVYNGGSWSKCKTHLLGSPYAGTDLGTGNHSPVLAGSPFLLTMAELDPQEKVIAAFAEALLPSLDKEADAAAKKGDDRLAKTLRLRGDFSPHVVKEV